jgi:hypothetical protein
MTTYFGFVDPSGGSSDSMTLGIAHSSKNVAVLDGVWEKKPPFSPEDVVEAFSETLKSYGITSVSGDRYGGLWPAERFRVHGIEYRPSERTRSEIYQEFLALANSRRVRLPFAQRLRIQFKTLERRTNRSGRDSVDHGPGGHDDVANAAAGALVLAAANSAGREPQLEVLSFDGHGQLIPRRGGRLPGGGYWGEGPESIWHKQ